MAELDGIPRDELAAARYEVTLDTLDLSDDLAECSYTAADGRAWVLTAVINLELDDEYEQSDVVVRYWVREREYVAFKGKAITISPMGGTTRLEAATGSYEAERVPIGEGDNINNPDADDWDLNNERPDAVLFMAGSLLPYENIDLPPLSDPPISRRSAEGNALKWYEYVEAAFAVVEEATQTRVVDDSTNVMRYVPVRPPRTDVASVWHIQSGSANEFPDTDEITDETASDAESGERYARVIVRDSTGRRVGFARVDNGYRKVHHRSTLFIDLPEGAVDSGQQLAADTAAFIGINARNVGAELHYPPFMLQRGANITATARTWAPGIQYERDFQFQTNTITVDVKGRKGTIGGPGRKLASRTIPLELTLPDLPAAVEMMWGYGPAGEPYLNTLLPWVTDDGDALILDTEVAASYGILIEEMPDGRSVLISRS
jgi:hypothetical protein